MKTDLDELYKPLAAALILGIILAAAFNIYMRWTISRGEGFSELYFNDHTNLPKDMRLNSTYNVSFTFANHELGPETYVYEVDSETMNQTREIELSVGESATITLQVTPHEQTWNLTWYVDRQKTEAVGGFGGGNVTRRFNITDFGEILHENLTAEELRAKPINTYSETIQNIENTTRQGTTNQTLKTDGRTITLETTEKTMEKTVAQKPFTIKIYKKGQNPGEELEIHYWYDAK